MRKSQLIVLLFALLGVALLAAPASAALGVHANNAYVSGACGQCHNVAATAATRGWGSTLPGNTGGWYDQKISLLCYTCHSSGAVGGAHDVTNTVFASGSHQFNESIGPPLPKTAMAAGAYENATMTGSGLPYTTKGKLECTSCHNVHDDTNRPFLHRPATAPQTAIGTLCSACHPQRVANSAKNQVDTVSVHPVGIAADNTATTASASAITVNVAMTTGLVTESIWTVSQNVWKLGGKLGTMAVGSSSGNMDCQTCHAVHGATAAPAEDLLAIDNRASATDNAVSGLCVGCHAQGDSGNPVGISGTDHPMSGYQGRSFYPTGVALPGDWTVVGASVTGASAFYNMSGKGNPRCSSCHDAHGGIAGTSILRPMVATSGDGQLSSPAWCWSCHSTARIVPNLHHSNTDTLGTSAINCSGCHGNTATAQQSWSAHNGFGNFAVGPDTNTATPTPGTGDFYTTTSNSGTFQNLCEKCHEPLNPTVWDNATTTVIASLPNNHNRVTPLTHTQSHFVSDFTSTTKVYFTDGPESGGRTYNSYFRKGSTTSDNSTWGTVSANAGIYADNVIRSKYANWGAGTPTNPAAGAFLVCESCHNLLYNAGTPASAADLTAGYDANLLVYQYEDDGAGAKTGTGEAAIGDGLCRGCHSTTPMAAADLSNPPAAAAYVHYPAAHTVGPNYNYGALTPYGRTTATVLTGGTCPDKTTADNTLAPGNFSYPNTNALNCDSCHRPHNAAVGGAFTTGSWAHQVILEPGTVGNSDAEKVKSTACINCHDTSTQCN